jgi:peroxiredoxin
MPFSSVARHATILLAATVLVVSGCGTPQAPSAQPPTVAPTTATPMATQSVSPVPLADSLKFTARTIDGTAFDAATLAGKPVVLWFWAAWCPKCRAKAGDVATVQREFAGKVHVVGVAGLGSGDAAMKKFATDTGINGFPHLADDTGVVWKKFGVTTQEYFVVIAADGQIVHKGPLSGADLRQHATTLAG